MPGLNRKGPDGMGPMTGGGRGLCNPVNRTFFDRCFSFMGGRGRGRGLGMGRRGGFCYGGPTYYDSNQEESTLRSEAEMLKNELERVERRLRGINKTE
jgi:hypothetical protein